MSSDAEATILSGTKISKEIRETLKKDVAELGEKFPGFRPGLAMVQVGGLEDSNMYVRVALKAAIELGITFKHIQLPKTIQEEELLTKIHKLNMYPNFHGIIVLMPLDSSNQINSYFITDSVSSEKDVDGLNTINANKIAAGDLTGFLPCTSEGVLELIKRTGISIAGKEAVVLGRSRVIATPCAELLKLNHATVTVCDSKTVNLKEVCSQADILVTAIGQPEMVKQDWVKKGAVVIDCGINFVTDPRKNNEHKLVGDVAFDECKKVASYITPVPGGVGPMTVCMLMANTVRSAERFAQRLTDIN